MALIPQPNPSTFTEGICSGYTPVSEIFTFNVDCQPTSSQNQHIQLAWLNRYGHWDYYTLLFNNENDGIALSFTNTNTNTL